jgi:hypothetical protein
VSILGPDATNYDLRFSLFFLLDFNISSNDNIKSYKQHIFLTFWPSTLKFCCHLFHTHSFHSAIYSHPFSLHCYAVEVTRLNKRNGETLLPVAFSVTGLKIPRHACNRITYVKYLVIRQRDWADITMFMNLKSCASMSGCRV